MIHVGLIEALVRLSRRLKSKELISIIYEDDYDRILRFTHLNVPESCT